MCVRDGFAGLLQAFVSCAAVCAAVLAPGFAGAAEYVEGMDSITLTVPTDGTTNTLSEALAAYNAANGTSYDVGSFNGGDLAAYALIKEGDGTLVMDTAISGFTGPVVVKDGVLACMCKYALGADVAESHVYVRDGATFWCQRISGVKVNENRTLHIVGSGHNGQGALASHVNRRGEYSQNYVHCKNLRLDGDASVMHPVWGYVANNLWLQGHTLTVNTVYSSSSKTHTDATWLVATIEDNGKIVMHDAIFYVNALYLRDATAGNEIEVGENAGFRFWASNFANVPGRDTWRFNFTGSTGWLWGDDSSGVLRFDRAKAERRNWIGNPIVLNGTTLKMNSQGNTKTCWMLLGGPVSGNGNIDIAYVNSRPSSRLSLVNPANSFTGSVRVDKGLLYVHEPGSLPSGNPLVVDRTGPLTHGFQMSNGVIVNNVALDYHGVEFVAPGEQSLGPLTFTGEAYQNSYYPGRIQGGSGAFSRIDKQSPNTMEYYSGIGAPLLNVEGGTVKLPRGPDPGLWEGTNATVIGGVFSNSAASTNLVARGPNVLNNTFAAHYGAKLGTSAANATYTGYIWNRTGADASWTFAMSAQQYTRMDIDGVEVMRQRRKNPADSTPNDDEHKFATVTLSPGPHLVHIRCFVDKLFSSTNAATFWPKDFGFVYDRQGRGSTDPNDFEIVIDPGDGSLFTRSVGEAALPHFDEMRFANGTTLDLNGNAYVASTISGLPTVTSSATDASAAPSLTISGNLVVDAADLEAGGKLSLDMPLSFGATGGVTVTNLLGVARKEYTIAEVSGDNAISAEGSFSSRCSVDGGRWTVGMSGDGKKIVLTPAAGFMIHLLR